VCPSGAAAAEEAVTAVRQAPGLQVSERQHRRQVLQWMQHRARPTRSKEPEGGTNVGHRHDPVAAGEEPRVAQGA
jgi:hypothetical protein